MLNARMIGGSAQKLLNFFGLRVVKKSDPVMDGDLEFQRIHDACKKYTMTSRERMYALYQAVRYVIKYDIPGDFVECGVWRGGSAMLIALTLLSMKATDRKIYLYDTFEGMSEPTKEDVPTSDRSADVFSEWKRKQQKYFNAWAFSPLSNVNDNMFGTGYPKDKIVFIKGKVEDTIPGTIPQNIALLRLDTDWYESTKHELDHLFARLSKKGILIIDDYGHWAGAKKAVDEFFADKLMLLNRIDYTGVIGVKTD